MRALIPRVILEGIAGPVALQGRPPELLGLVATLVIMKVSRSDLAPGFAGVAVVALARAVL